MADQSQGEGWWQASDQKWYPPESHPDYKPAPPPQPEPEPKPERNALPVWVLPVLLVSALVIIGIVVSGGDDDGPSGTTGTSQSDGGGSLSLSEAFCNDIEGGATPLQIYGGVKEQYEPDEFADLAYGFAAIDCPGELVSNDALRTFLEAWGINPDA